MAQVILLVQMMLYFLIAATGLVVAVPIGVAMMNLSGRCILYGNVDFESSTHFTFVPGSKTPCVFSIGVPVVACAIYGLIRGFYNCHVLSKANLDPTLIPRMWIMPFLLLNGLVTVLVFIMSCMITVGFLQWCYKVVTGAKEYHMNFVSSCPDLRKIKWEGFDDAINFTSFYTFFTIAQGASWALLIMWVAQVALYITRFVRGRQPKQQDIDTIKIGNLQPTA